MSGGLFAGREWALFLSVHLLPLLPLYNEALIAPRSRPAPHSTAWDPVLNSICATHSPPLSPRPVAVSLSLTGHHSPIHPCGGTSILQALQAIHPPSPSVRTTRLHQAPPGRGSPLPQSWRLTCLNYSQSVPSIVRCCTPHRSYPCAPRPSEQVSWMGLALNDSPSLAPHARPRISGAAKPASR
ncbi:hypothetical protein F5882DRAFT_389560 [Hyaloscypha sp. PMI_1271]|nr:hypothetical protein F5882DRAFT_389560 [Hyaloscypha sp. PMI_1271]